MKPKHATVIA